VPVIPTAAPTLALPVTAGFPALTPLMLILSVIFLLSSFGVYFFFLS
jgi:hypothetical protein